MRGEEAEKVATQPATSSLRVWAWLLGSGCKGSTPSTQPAGSRGDGSPPKLVLDRTFIDAGVMGRQKTRDVVVTVRNAGGSELVIEGARSACECFKAAFDRKRIAPGQSAAMTVNIRTLKRRGETTDKVAAISNDPAGPKLVTVRFEVADELAVIPSRLHLGLARPGQTVRRCVKLVANVQGKTGTGSSEAQRRRACTRFPEK